MNCEATLSSCECSLEQGHEGPHICECEGSWGDDGTIHAWPERYVGPPGGRRGYETFMPALRMLTDVYELNRDR